MGLMDPVGPEEPRTYWIRRAIVGGVMLVIVIAVIVIATQLRGGGEPTQAEPPPATGPSLQPAETSTPPPSNDPSGDPSGEPSGGQSSKDTDSKQSKEPSKSPTTSASKPPTSREPTKPAKPAACDPSDLRTTLTGPRTVTAEKKVSFEAGVINGGKQTCTFTLDPKSYVFRVHSGTDEIWTTEDCAKWLPKVEAELKPEQDVTWKINWTAQRSKGCDLESATLKAGTYAANSLLTDAPPAQLVMQLK